MDSLATNYDPNAGCDDGSCVYPPANDDCANAIAIACNSSATGTNAGASANSPSASNDALGSNLSAT